MADNLEQLRKRAERLEELAKQKTEEIELKKRIRTAKATLRQHTLIATLYRGLKKRADRVVNDAIN